MTQKQILLTYEGVTKLEKELEHLKTFRRADVAEKYNAAAIKVTGAQRLAIVGIQENDIDDIWNELGMSAGAAVGL